MITETRKERFVFLKKKLVMTEAIKFSPEQNWMQTSCWSWTELTENIFMLTINKKYISKFKSISIIGNFFASKKMYFIKKTLYIKAHRLLASIKLF